MKVGSKRGMVLITSLMIVTILSMILIAAIQIVPSSGALTANVADRLRAEAAAESGMHYALSKLKDRPDWRGDDNVTVSDWPRLYVREHNGNVIGLMGSDSGSVTQFRIRFNYNDGAHNASDPTDRLADSAIPIANPYVSVSNVLGGSPMPVPRADGSNYSVTSTSPRVYDAVPFSLCLIVEGRSGRGLNGANPTNLDPTGGGTVTSRVLEAAFRLNDVGSLDAVASAGADILVNGGSKEQLKIKTVGGGVARMRSKSKVEVKNDAGGQGDYIPKDTGEARIADGLSSNFLANAVGTVTLVAEGATDPFYQLKWADVEKAPDSGPKMPAGTYVWWDTVPPSLHYYDMNYEAYVAYVKAAPANAQDAGKLVGPGMDIEPPTSVVIDPSKRTVKTTDSLYLEPTAGGTTDFTLIPREGAPEDPPGSGGGPVDASAVGDHLAQIPGASHAQGAQIYEFFQAVSDQWAGSKTDLALKDYVPAWPGADKKIDMPNVASWTWDGTVAPTAAEFAHIAQQLELAGGPSVSSWGTLFNLGGGTPPPGDMQEFNLGTGDAITAEELKFEILAPKGTNVVVSAEGDVRLGSAVKGTGSSITAGGQIRLVGSGVNMSSVASSANDGVSLYAREDVVLSTLKTKDKTKLEYADFSVKGVIYTWGNFHAKLDHPSIKDPKKFKLSGALVAYGGNVDADAVPGTAGGHIRMDVSSADLTFDPAYVAQLTLKFPDGIRFKRLLYGFIAK